MRDLANNIGIVPAVVPAVLTATATGDPIDLLGFRSAALIVQTGAIAGDGDFTASLQESDTDQPGDFAPVEAGDLIGALPETLEAASVVKVGYVGHKRFIRAVLTKNGGTSIAAGAVIVKGHANERPVA